MNKKRFFKDRIDKIAKESFNNEQKEIAKKIIDNTNDNDLDAVWGLISQRIKTGFVFDEAPEINHDCVAYIKENKKLGINIGKENAIEHTLIIGENYDALKNLIAIYTDNQGKGLIDVIYIDPPYNTDKSKQEGNNYKEEVEGKNKFIYRDKYTRDGWLNMLDERLKLAKKLLSDNGVIFISIDDSEQAYLKVLCDEIFGEENYVGTFIRKTATQRAMAKYFNIQHEYCLLYCKEKGNFSLLGAEKDFTNYSNPDNDINGDWKISDPTMRGSTNAFEIENPYTGQIDIPPIGRGWAFTKEKLREHIISGKIIFKKYKKNNERGFIYKAYKNNLKSENLLLNSLDFCDNAYLNQVSSKEMIKIFEINKFDYAKPEIFIENLIKYNPNKYVTILDFFAGSGTTGQAVMELNEEDGGNRKFILVTNNENNIATNITRERLYRVINGKGSKGEEFEWRFSNDKKNLPNNSLRVFDIVKEKLNITDIDKAEKIKNEAESNFIKLNPNYKSKSDIDIYNVLSSLTPYKDESEE